MILMVRECDMPLSHGHSFIRLCVDGLPFSIVLINISPGTLVLFPAWVEHYVLPQPPPRSGSVNNNGTRIAISFNARVKHINNNDAHQPPLTMHIPKGHARTFQQYTRFDN